MKYPGKYLGLWAAAALAALAAGYSVTGNDHSPAPMTSPAPIEPARTVVLTDGRRPTWESGGLCNNGHPRPRPSQVSYGGLPPRPGFERDHIMPLCLGGADTRDNVQYQPLPKARTKDRLERKAL